MAEATNDQLREQVGRIQSQQAIDPTSNVLEHVRSAVQRLDDLREAEERSLRREMELRATYEEKLAIGEQKRLEALRAIDSKTLEQVQQQITTMAETFRQQLGSTAQLLQNSVSEVQRNQLLNQGAKTQLVEGRQQNQWAIGAGLSVLGLGITVVGIAIALTQ